MQPPSYNSARHMRSQTHGRRGQARRRCHVALRMQRATSHAARNNRGMPCCASLRTTARRGRQPRRGDARPTTWRAGTQEDGARRGAPVRRGGLRRSGQDCGRTSRHVARGIDGATYTRHAQRISTRAVCLAMPGAKSGPAGLAHLRLWAPWPTVSRVTREPELHGVRCALPA